MSLYDEQHTSDDFGQDLNKLSSNAQELGRYAKRMHQVRPPYGVPGAAGSGTAAAGGAAAAGSGAATAGARSGAVAAGAGSGAAAAGGTAAAAGGASAGVPVVLIVFLVFLGIFFIIGIQAMLPAIWSNSLTHINDPEQLSLEEDIFECGTYDENVATMNKKMDDLTTALHGEVVKVAINDAYAKIARDAARHGWDIDMLHDVTISKRQLEMPEIYVHMLAAYSASFHNYLSDSAFDFFQSNISTKDMVKKLLEPGGIKLARTEVPELYQEDFPWGNYMYGMDYVRDEDGNVIVAISEITGRPFVHVEYSFTSFSSVFEPAFGFENGDSYDPDWSDSTYGQVIEAMCQPVYEIFYPEYIKEAKPGGGYNGDYFYESPPLNDATAFVEIAITQVGQYGGKPYWSWYGLSSRDEWCAMFVSWCAAQSKDVSFEKFASCNTGIQMFKRARKYVSCTRYPGYKPDTGNLIFIDWKCDGVVDHVGIVILVGDGLIYTVEGNTGEFPGVVAQKTYRITDPRIAGYALTG